MEKKWGRRIIVNLCHNRDLKGKETSIAYSAGNNISYSIKQLINWTNTLLSTNLKVKYYVTNRCLRTEPQT